MQLEPITMKHPAVKDAAHADVLVVGAGASGIPAAISAARCGAKVVLLEEDQCIGGAPVDMFVTFLCGGPRRGIFRELCEKLNEKHDISGSPIPDFNSGHDGKDHWYMPSSFLLVLNKMIADEPNIKVINGAKVVNAIVSEKGNRNRVRGAIYAKAGGALGAVTADISIDATGTGEFAVAAGADYLYGQDAASDFNEQFAPETATNRVMHCTLMFISQKLRPGPAIDLEKLKTRSFLEPGYTWAGEDPEGFKQRNIGAYLHWGSTVACQDTRDPVAIGAAQQEALKKAEADLETLIEHGYAVHLAPKLGVRESRRVVGEYVLSLNDLKAGAKPDDTMAYANYPLDIWGQKLTTEEKKLPPYGIPYRAMIPKKLEGMLVVGKAMSGTHIAMSSFRVQPIVAGIGQAAGVAAAIAASKKTGLRSIPLEEAQNKLREMGILD